ncbi:unnamed protein product, partial [Larinioides sclopetarius]
MDERGHLSLSLSCMIFCVGHRTEEQTFWLRSSFLTSGGGHFFSACRQSAQPCLEVWSIISLISINQHLGNMVS